MIYAKGLPTMGDLQRLAADIRNYPISDLGVIQFAEHSGYDDNMVNFLKLFYRQIIFHSRTEFLNYCRLVRKLMAVERQLPAEQLRSP